MFPSSALVLLYQNSHTRVALPAHLLVLPAPKVGHHPPEFCQDEQLEISFHTICSWYLIPENVKDPKTDWPKSQ